MATSNEFENIPETEETEQSFSPVYSFTQKLQRLQSEGKLEYPKYRTLSEEQTRSYLTAKDSPEYQRKSQMLDLKKADENTFWQNAKNTAIIESMDILSGDRTELALGNMLVTEDYEPLVGAGLGVAGAEIGRRAAKEAGKGWLKQTVAGVAGATGVGAIASILDPTELGDATLNDVATLESARISEKDMARQQLKAAGFTDEQIEKLQKPTAIQSVGQVLLKDAMDRIEYKAAIAPKVDEGSVAATIVGGALSMGEYLMLGAGGKIVASKIAKSAKMPTDRWGRKAAEFEQKKGTKYEDVVDRYAGMVGTKAGTIAATTNMSAEVMGGGALESIQKYVEDTGDTNLDYYTGDIKNVALDAYNTHIQNVIEQKLGLGKFIKNPRLATKYGEWLNGFAQEFSQGEVNDFVEWVKGDKTIMEVVQNIPQNVIEGIVGGVLQGGIGTATYSYYHSKNVNDLTGVIVAQSTPENPITEKQAREFAEKKVAEIEEGVMSDVAKDIVEFTGATQYQGKIYDTVRDNIKKTIDYQREQMKDTLEGSKYDDMSEDELAQHVESVAQDMTDRIVIEALDKKIPLSEVPQLKGETIEGTYYIEGSDYAKETAEKAQKDRETIRELVYAQKSAEKAAKEAEKAAKAVEREIARQANSEKTQTKQAITHGSVDIIADILSKNGFKTRGMSGTAIKELGKLNWELFKGQDLGQAQSRGAVQVAQRAIEENVESGDRVLERAGYTQEEIKKMDDETWNRAVLTQYRKESAEMQTQEPELNPDEIPDLDFQDLADENESLDAIYPAYDGETIEVDGKERTVYNSNGDRIAKSKEALTNFWRWFGDSKVVDEQGRPLVVYHGTESGGFDTFLESEIGSNTKNAEVGFFFGDKRIARTYSGTDKTITREQVKEFNEDSENGFEPDYIRGLYPVYLKMTDDVAIYDFRGASWDGKAYGKYALKNEEEYDWLRDENDEIILFDSIKELQDYVDSHPEAEEYTQWDDPQIEESTKDLAVLEKENGASGIIIKNVNDAGRHSYGGEEGDVYVVFASTQIKSVDNRGTYSSDTGNIYFQDRQRGKGGAYDARTRSVTLGGGANVTTLPHELAHYWIDKNFKWARSGKASQAWLDQWRAVEKWLGIDPEDKYLDKNASEKFARAYERFLGEEQLPLVLKKSMADFRDFVLDHYDYELDDAKGLQDKLGRPIKLDEGVKAWFRKSVYDSYMSPQEAEVVNQRLAQDDRQQAELQPAIEQTEEVQKELSDNPEINQLNVSGKEIQEDAGVSNDVVLGKRTIGGGEEKESRGKIGQALGKTYESTTWEIQENMVDDYLKTVSLDEAIDALDNGTYPDKIDPNFLRNILADKLIEEGRELEAAALIEQTAEDFTQAAQTLQAARRFNTPFTNAIKMLSVSKAMKLAQAKFGKKADAVEQLDAAINALVQKYEADFMAAQTDEERELVYATMQDEAIRTIGTLDKSRTNDLDFQDVDDKEERQQAKAIRIQQKKRASINGYRSRAKRALKQALGIAPTREQVRNIKKLSVKVAKEINEYRRAVKNNTQSAIDPTKILEAQNELNNYMNQEVPAVWYSDLGDAVNSFMMANMLWNPATNVFNIESTWVQMMPHLLATTINNRNVGSISWKEKRKLIKQALVLQAKTGYNIFSLRDFFDKKTLWAEKFYEPKTKLGKFQALPLTALGLMDTMNKGIVFLQHADAMATKQATEEGKKNGWNKTQIKERAKELFYQSLNTDPRTITMDGLKIRQSAVIEGEEATFTQNTKTAEIVNKVRKALNLGAKTGVGTLIMPFTTTIANIAEDTVLNYGLGSVRGLRYAPKAIALSFDKKATAEMKKEAWKAVQPETKNVIKNMIGALLLASVAFGDDDDDDYVLGYDRQTEKDKDIRQNRNAPSGYAIRIGNKWIDVDLFGIGSQWMKMYMIANRGGNTTDSVVQAVASNIDMLPGISEVQDMYDKYSQMSKWKGDKDAILDLVGGKAEELGVRLIPMSALFNQIGNITDDTKRESWNTWYDAMRAKIPGLREDLPARLSKQTGKEIPQTDVFWNLATGQRVKDYVEPTKADEARYMLYDLGINMNYREKNSKLKELGVDSERYKKAVREVRSIFSAELPALVDSWSFRNADEEGKRKAVSKLHTKALETVKANYGLDTKKSLKKKK